MFIGGNLAIKTSPPEMPDLKMEPPASAEGTRDRTHTENQKVKTNKQYLTLEAVVCRTIYTFAPTALLVNVYCSKSLVWFEASGLHYAPSILNPQWDSSWISSCCSVSWRFLQLWFCRTSPFTCSALNRWGRSSDVITLMSWI